MKRSLQGVLWMVVLGVSPVFEVSGVMAQGAPGAAAGGVESPGIGAVLLQQLPLFAMVFAIFYLLVLRPQQAKLRAHQELIKGLKRGDHVVTSSGVFGRVFSVEADHIAIEIAPNVKIRVEPSHIVRRHEEGGGESAHSSSSKKGGAKAAAG